MILFYKTGYSQSELTNFFMYIISIGNHMISNAIWDKSARVNFSKTNKIARARRASAICSLKNLRVRIYPQNSMRKSCDYLLIIYIQNFTLRVD